VAAEPSAAHGPGRDPDHPLQGARHTAHTRIAKRATADTHRSAHADAGLLEAIAAGNSAIEAFVPIAMDLPILDVDTTNGHRPGLADIVAFATTTQA
jgi:hypothetical protein